MISKSLFCLLIIICSYYALANSEYTSWAAIADSHKGSGGYLIHKRQNDNSNFDTQQVYKRSNKKSEDHSSTAQATKAPSNIQTHRILIYRDSNCTDCEKVHNELKKHNIEYNDIDVSWNRKERMILERRAGKKDVSYVFIGNQYIGNHDDLISIMKEGRLFRALQAE